MKKTSFLFLIFLLSLVWAPFNFAIDVESFKGLPEKLAFFPGSFDPPTRSHLSTVKSLIDDYKFEKVYVVLNTRGPKNYVTSIDQRMEMLKAGLATHARNIVFVNEPVDGKEPLKMRIQEEVGQKLWGVTGGDGWDLLPKEVQEDASKKWVIMPRPELQQVEFPDRPNVVQLIPEGMEDGTSSSFIRKSIAEGNFPDGPLPQVIKEIIVEKGYYQTLGGDIEKARLKRAFNNDWLYFKEAFGLSNISRPEFKEHQTPEAWRDNFVRVVVEELELSSEEKTQFWKDARPFIKGGRVTNKSTCQELMLSLIL
jgi:nicotinic acid mononucleotide adenylyltransferase